MNFLDAITLFGNDLSWEVGDVLFLLFIVLLVVIVFMVVAFVALRRRIGKGNNVVVEGDKKRALTKLSLDVSIVNREFATGGEFDCMGLIVTANYNIAPYIEQTSEYEMVTREEFAAIKTSEWRKKKNVAIVIVPDTTEAGQKDVIVWYKGERAVYAISVGEHINEEHSDENVADAVAEQGGEAIFAETTEEVSEETAEATEEAAEGTAEVTEEVAEGTDEVTEEVAEGTDEATEEAAEGTAEANEEVAEGTAETTEEVAEGTAEATEEAAEGTDEVTEEVAEGTDEATEEVAEGTDEVTEEVAEETAEATEEVAAAEQPVQVVATETTYIIEEFDEDSEDGLFNEFRKRYNRSFTARLIQSSDETKDWYGELKNYLLSYKKVKGRISWKRETFKRGRDMIAKMSFRGNTLCLFLPLDPNEYADTKYKVEDASENASYADTPCMYRIKNERRVKYAMELIAEVMERLGIVMTEREPENYYMPYEKTGALIDKGLIKVVDEAVPVGNQSEVTATEEAVVKEQPEQIEDQVDEQVEEQPVEERQPIAEEQMQVEEEEDEDDDSDDDDEDDDDEESEPKVVTERRTSAADDEDQIYDKSFRAKVIQSRATTKGLYSDIKNELLAYNGISDKLSWECESYNLGNKRVAKFIFEDKVLCLCVSTNPAEFADAQQKVADVSGVEDHTDTPAMICLKNYEQYQCALDLIRKAMADCGVERMQRKSVNYNVPSQSTRKLLAQGLVRKIN